MELTKETLRHWWLTTTGETHFTNVLGGLWKREPVEKLAPTYNQIKNWTKALADEKVIAKAGGKRDGIYRLVDKAEEEMMWWLGEDIDDSKVNLILPFGLHKAVYIPRPAFITISGDTNAGKSAIADWILNVNQDRFDECKILMTEGLEMFKDRMMHAQPRCPIPPHFQTYVKASHFEDDILTNGLTVLDYVRPPKADALMSIGTPLEAIAGVVHKGTGIVVVCMQKPRGERGEAFGGVVTEWDAALSMSIHSTTERFVSYLKLNKIKKHLKTDVDLYKLKVRFRITHGIQLTELEKVYE